MRGTGKARPLPSSYSIRATDKNNPVDPILPLTPRALMSHGCSHKRRLHKVVLRGAPLDVSSFWDGGILEAEAKSAAGGCPTEFYAGGVCLTRVLGYHDVLHFKTRLAAELRTTLERALRDRGFRWVY